MEFAKQTRSNEEKRSPHDLRVRRARQPRRAANPHNVLIYLNKKPRHFTKRRGFL